MSQVVASRPRTLGEILAPSSSRAGDVSLVLGGAGVTALAAQATIPLQPVPFTLQTLAVMLCGLALGARRGMLSQLTYVAAGTAGAPVFAGFTGGPGHLFGPTGGYLAGFVLAAWVLGVLADRGWTRSVGLTLAAMALGTAVVLGLGWAWLTAYIGPAAAFSSGVAPFLLGEGLKAAFAVLALPTAWRLVGDPRTP